MIEDMKFNDTVVRSYPILESIAKEYVLGYRGEFEPLVKASQVLALGGDLSVGQVRTVLNCLRVDSNPWITDLQSEALSVLNEAPPHLRLIKGERSEPVKKKARPKAEPYIPPRPTYVTTKATSRVRFTICTNSAGTPLSNGVMHIVRSSGVRWQLNSDGSRKPMLMLDTHCGNGAVGWYSTRLLLTEPMENRRFCATCTKQVHATAILNLMSML